MNVEAQIRAITQGGDDPDRLLTSTEAAKLLGFSSRTIEEWGRTGKLRRVVIGRHVRYRDADVRALIRAGME